MQSPIATENLGNYKRYVIFVFGVDTR